MLLRIRRAGERSQWRGFPLKMTRRADSQFNRMIAQQVKNLYFALNRWLVMPNTLLARARFRTPPDPEGWYLHLGSGPAYIPGMVNIEGYFARRKDLWLDLKNRLPFADQSAVFVYCSHTLEHFYPNEAMFILREIHRVLKPDGVARIATPSLEHALHIASGTPATDPQRVFGDPHGQAIDYLFCDGQHKYGYSFSVMEKFARDAGFTRVTKVDRTPKKYGKIEVGNELTGSLIVELQR
jgi:predicted SAM-dependent methyltransferase